MKTVVLTYKGRDSWDRPVYEAAGRLYVDVNPRNPINRISAQSTRMSLMVNRILRLPKIFRLNLCHAVLHGIE